MSLRQGLPTNRNAEADRTTYTSNVTTTPTHNLSGRDPNETRSSLTDTLDIAEASEVTTTKYSKRSSGKFKFSPILICMNFVSILPDLC